MNYIVKLLRLSTEGHNITSRIGLLKVSMAQLSYANKLTEAVSMIDLSSLTMPSELLLLYSNELKHLEDSFDNHFRDRLLSYISTVVDFIETSPKSSKTMQPIKSAMSLINNVIKSMIKARFDPNIDQVRIRKEWRKGKRFPSCQKGIYNEFRSSINVAKKLGKKLLDISDLLYSEK